jgi:hypothetical protein
MLAADHPVRQKTLWHESGNSETFPVVYKGMRTEWAMRQILAVLRGIAFMLGIFWIFLGLQFVPAFLRGGPAAVRDHLVRVAVAGIPVERWPIAIMRMEEALAILGAVAVGTYLLQRLVARKITRSMGSHFD